MYLFGFALVWGLGYYRIHNEKWVNAQRTINPAFNWTAEQLSDLVFYGALGAVIGGRVGYMLFYQFNEWIASPKLLFYVWTGGMSFHGGILGVVLAVVLFVKKYQKSFAEVADFVAPLAPLGLGLGRIGNFINGELWGRVTENAWGMVFPFAGPLPRYPTQLFEAFGEGLLLFIIVWIYSIKPRPPFAVSGVFLAGYGVIRFTIEFLREPDAHIGFIAFGWLTEGQLLSIPMIVIGVAMLIWAYRKKESQ
jgi:phosphatidylglycerol:prolipoprotein diacylglycerol transferase